MTNIITVHTCTECGGGFFEHPRRRKCHRCYEAARKAGQVPGLVDATQARDHIEALVSAGWNYNQIARAARIDRSLIAFIVNGRVRINADTAFHICSVDAARHAEYKVPAISPESAKARARKVWETRRAKAAEAKAAQAAAAAERERLEQARRRDAAERRRGVCSKHQPAKVAYVGLPGLPPPEDWQDDALCNQVDPELWFPEKGGSTREAKKICLSCTVREPCLEYALEKNERFGIWGGMSERERRRLVKGIA